MGNQYKTKETVNENYVEEKKRFAIHPRPIV